MPAEQELINTQISKSLKKMKEAFVDALSGNAVEALIAGDVKAHQQLGMSINFNLISSKAVQATKEYRETLERFGGSDVTEIGTDGIARRVFKPWLKDSIESDRVEFGKLIEDSIKDGRPLKEVEAEIDRIFANREINAKLTAFQETKQNFNTGTFDRYDEEGITQAEWLHEDAQPNPRLS